MCVRIHNMQGCWRRACMYDCMTVKHMYLYMYMYIDMDIDIEI